MEHTLTNEAHQQDTSLKIAEGEKVLESLATLTQQLTHMMLEQNNIYGKIAMQGAFVLNGMAAVAILYNIKSLGNIGVEALQLCAIGALLAIISAGFLVAATTLIGTKVIVYFINIFTYLYATMREMKFGEKSVATSRPELPSIILGIIVYVFHIVLWASSLVCFAWATYKVTMV